MRIAFAGLGAMGLPMAINLIRAGHAVVGLDLKEASLAALEAAGGQRAANPAAAAKAADLAVLMVVNGDQAEAVLFGEAGMADELARAKGLAVLCCTQPPAQAEAIGARLAAAGIGMLDAPVSGGVGGARTGSLSIMAAGPASDFARARPVLNVLGERIYHVGERHGQGSTVKMVNQLLCGVHIAAAAEAMALGAAAGIDAATLFDVVSNSAASSWMLKDRVPRMLETDPAIASAVDIFVKDLGIVTDHGKRTRFPTPVAAAALQQFIAASAMGAGSEDDSAVVKVYERLTGHAPERR